MSGTPDRAEVVRDAAPEGVTRGFLFADLRGYTEFVERHGGEAAAQLLARYRALVREQVAAFRGAEIKTEGDSFYVVFPSASAAVRAGLAILAEAARESAEQPEQPIRVGVGVHAGETVETTEGYVGTPVNIAARLCAIAGAGDLLVSDTVRALTSTVIRAQFVPRGRRQLKGIAEPIQVFAVTTGSRPAATWPRLRVRPSGLGAGAAALAAIVVAAAVGALVFGRPGAAPASASPTNGSAATTSLRPSPSASGSGMTRGERDLLEAVPADVAAHCEIARDEAIVSSTATVRCDLPIGSGADTVWWHYFESEGLTALAFDRIADARSLPAGVACGPDVAAGRAPWSLGRTLNGDRACYMDEDGAWAVWTYGDEQIIARAVRNDGDVRELDAWWEDIAQYLRVT